MELTQIDLDRPQIIESDQLSAKMFSCEYMPWTRDTVEQNTSLASLERVNRGMHVRNKSRGTLDQTCLGHRVKQAPDT